MIEVILLWPVFAILSFLVASFKGRSGCGFAILTLIFGPLGLIAAAIASPDRGVSADLKSGKMFRCLWCREPVRLGASVCPHCQRENP